MSAPPRRLGTPMVQRLGRLSDLNPNSYREMGKEGLTIAKESLIVLKEIRDELRALRDLLNAGSEEGAKDP